MGVALLLRPGAMREERAHFQRYVHVRPAEIHFHLLAFVDEHLQVAGPPDESGSGQPAASELLLTAAMSDAVRAVGEEIEQ